jgi:hypothetical protein
VVLHLWQAQHISRGAAAAAAAAAAASASRTSRTSTACRTHDRTGGCSCTGRVHGERRRQAAGREGCVDDCQAPQHTNTPHPGCLVRLEQRCLAPGPACQ